MAEPVRIRNVHPISSIKTTLGVQTNPNQQAYKILLWGFVALPIIAGLDKFFMVLTDWNKYLASFVTQIVSGRTFMSIVGVVEIAAGLLVAFKPRVGAIVVGLWL